MHILSINKLILTNFRNYHQAMIELEEDVPVVICGRNGAGKTNILEAISLLAPGRGIRGAKLADIDCQNTPDQDHAFAGSPWSIFAEINAPEGDVTIATGRDAASSGDKRIVKIDNELQPNQGMLGYVMSVVSLTPQMDQIFAEGATSRRNYLDKIVSVFFPEHARQLGIYEHAKSERRKLLQRPHPDPHWLDSLEKRMAESGVAIAAERIETLQHLVFAVDQQYQQNSELFPKPILSIEGLVEESLHRITALETEKFFAEKLKHSRQTDAATGRTNVGPHRSDFIAVHPVKHLKAELCSTGEQKAILLAITLATVRAKQAWMDQSPILLLDEVVSHLDDTKRAALLDEILSLEAQTFMTGTETGLFHSIDGEAQFILVDNARILG